MFNQPCRVQLPTACVLICHRLSRNLQCHRENGWQDQNSEDGEESGDDGSWEEEVGAAEEAARGEGNAGDEELDDEALAQQLQEEEAREHYRRLLEMLGGGVDCPACGFCITHQ